MRDFRRLEVWQKAHETTLEIYRLTTEFPSDEKFGLVSQVRRSAASIGANLAEGSGRETDGDYCRFVDIAAGSACETEYHLQLARDLGFLRPDSHSELDARVNEV